MANTAYLSRSISYTFGPGQAEGIDNVTTTIRTATVDPFSGATVEATGSATVQLPAQGWKDADVLAAMQAKFPQFTVAWDD